MIWAICGNASMKVLRSVKVSAQKFMLWEGPVRRSTRNSSGDLTSSWTMLEHKDVLGFGRAHDIRFFSLYRVEFTRWGVVLLQQFKTMAMQHIQIRIRVKTFSSRQCRFRMRLLAYGCLCIHFLLLSANMLNVNVKIQSRCWNTGHEITINSTGYPFLLLFAIKNLGCIVKCHLSSTNSHIHISAMQWDFEPNLDEHCTCTLVSTVKLV